MNLNWKHLSLIPMTLLLTSASLHNQISVNPITRQLTVNLHGTTLYVNLDAPETRVEKYADGKLKRLTIQQVSSIVDIRFHHLMQKEDTQPAQVARYRVQDETRILDGPSRSFSPSGRLLVETNWKDGKLNGKQLVYDDDGQLREEREFTDGFPIGTYKIYYPDGKLASEITFPDSLDSWMATADYPEFAGEQEFTSLPFFQPVKGKEIWYNANGEKQKEIALAFCRNQDRPMILSTGEETVFDHQGKVIRQKHLWDGTGNETSTSKAAGNTLQKTVRHWVNGQLFKAVSWRDLP